jgi:restriction system protein
MTVWVARAGSYGEREDMALEEGRAFIGWGDLPDLTNISSKDDIEAMLEAASPETKIKRIKNHAAQVYNFRHAMKVGHMFALPLKGRPAIAFGRIAGDYEYLADHPYDAKHSRKIEWQGEPIPRNKIDQDILNSFGSSLTVFTVSRNDAENRLKALLEGKEYRISQREATADAEAEVEGTLDLEERAKEQISDFIGRKFHGHRMEELVAAILRAQGYTVMVNQRKGPDGGADLLAAKGSMGFDEPKLCVQVKSSDQATGIADYNGLKGVMQNFKAQHGLFVAWGGFTSDVLKEARRDFFNIRLWNAEELVHELQGIYKELPEEFQVEIPLQRVWVLAD